ncbi:TPA: hypothetical protein PC537_001663 [Morganella morganii]|nr:hypothetical protein [Morganella morganii]
MTNRSTVDHSRYDVTILMNGLPLVRIELKTRGWFFRPYMKSTSTVTGYPILKNCSLFYLSGQRSQPAKP